MGIPVEGTVWEELCHRALNSEVGQLLPGHRGLVLPEIIIRHGPSPDKFKGQQPAGRPVPVDLGKPEPIVLDEIPPDLLDVKALEGKVQFFPQGDAKLIHQGDGLEPLRRSTVPFDRTRQHPKKVESPLNFFLNLGSLNLQNDLIPVGE
jgi:hypothetical protein